jgi:hypothetical protein
MTVIGGERAMTEKKQKTTTHNVKEGCGTKKQGPSLTKKRQHTQKE